MEATVNESGTEEYILLSGKCEVRVYPQNADHKSGSSVWVVQECTCCPQVGPVFGSKESALKWIEGVVLEMLKDPYFEERLQECPEDYLVKEKRLVP